MTELGLNLSRACARGLGCREQDGRCACVGEVHVDVPYGQESPEGWACTGPSLAYFGLSLNYDGALWRCGRTDSAGQEQYIALGGPCEAVAAWVGQYGADARKPYPPTSAWVGADKILRAFAVSLDGLTYHRIFEKAEEAKRRGIVIVVARMTEDGPTMTFAGQMTATEFEMSREIAPEAFIEPDGSMSVYDLCTCDAGFFAAIGRRECGTWLRAYRPGDRLLIDTNVPHHTFAVDDECRGRKAGGIVFWHHLVTRRPESPR